MVQFPVKNYLVRHALRGSRSSGALPLTAVCSWAAWRLSVSVNPFGASRAGTCGRKRQISLILFDNFAFVFTGDCKNSVISERWWLYYWETSCLVATRFVRHGMLIPSCFGGVSFKMLVLRCLSLSFGFDGLLFRNTGPVLVPSLFLSTTVNGQAFFSITISLPIPRRVLVSLNFQQSVCSNYLLLCVD